MKAQKAALTGILAATICLLAPFSFPIGAIPVSLATLAIYIISGTVKTKISVSAVIIYILLGAIGLPVFSAFQGGFQTITGLTGGYILGYIPCALIIGMLSEKYESKKWVYPLSMILGTVACYLTGTLWYMFQADCSFATAMTVCVIPFIIADIIKISAACTLCITLRKRLSVLQKIY